MDEFLARLKQRKIVQWAVAYVAGTWVVLQVLSLVSDSYHWPDAVMHVAFGVLAVGFVVVLVLAWYHGERGLQRVGSMEIMILAVLLAIGGGLIWHFARTPSTPGAASRIAMATTPPAASVKARHAPAAMTRAVAARSTSIAAPATSPVAVPSIPAKSVAVLPFENLSTDKGNAYFADGIQDLILTKLADIGDLKVISRTSTESYGSHPGNLKQIGQQLGVATILEGSVQKAGNQVLINVQLIDAKTDSHIWAQSYQRTLDNIFGVEGEVAGKVAQALNAKLTAAETHAVARVPTQDSAAYDAYLRGLMLEKNLSTTKSRHPLRDAEGFYAQAVKLDSGFALAWAHLAYIKILMYAEFVDRSPAFLAQAKQAVHRALQLQPNLGEGYLVLAQYYYRGVRNLDAAIPPLQKARELLPNNADVLVAMSDVEERQGKWQLANARLRQAALLEPRSVDWLVDLAWNDIAQREFGQARATLNRALVIAPDDSGLIGMKAYAWQQEGNLDAAQKLIDALPPLKIVHAHARQFLYTRDYNGAIAMVRRLLAKPGLDEIDQLHYKDGLGYVLYLAGQKAAARKSYAQLLIELKHARQSPADDIGLASMFADAYMVLGNKVAALNAARRNVAVHSYCSICKPDAVAQLAQIQARFGNRDAALAVLPHLLTVPAGLTVANLRLDPAWDPIRHDPRFQALLKKYGASEPATAGSGAGHA